MRYDETPVVEVLADGLDASTDGRGWDINHQKAMMLANTAPELLRKARSVVAAWRQGDLGARIQELGEVVNVLDAAKVDE